MSKKKASVIEGMRTVRDELGELLTRAYNTPASEFRPIAIKIAQLYAKLGHTSQDALALASETTAEEEDKRPKKPVESPWPPYVFKSDMRR